MFSRLHNHSSLLPMDWVIANLVTPKLTFFKDVIIIVVYDELGKTVAVAAFDSKPVLTEK